MDVKVKISGEIPILNNSRTFLTGNCESFRRKVLYSLIALSIPALLPFLHISIFYYLWQEFNRAVDRNLCSCSCWDTVFKGNYEVGVSGYKHVYFNATLNTFKIWFSTVVAIILCYEFSLYLIRLVWKNLVNYWMLALFVISIYPNYYSWWAYFNYLNDEFYSQIYHQTYFTFTELASTVAILYLADKRRSNSLLPLLVILNVAVAHILISSFDQMVANVVFGDGGLHQVLRDVGMFIPDVINSIVAVRQMQLVGTMKGIPTAYLVSNRMFLASVSFITLSCLLCLCI